MAKRFTKEELDSIIIDYRKGMCPKELGIKYNRNPTSIIKKLQSIGVYVNTTTHFTTDEIERLSNYYIAGEWSSINKEFPLLTKQQIYVMMSRRNVHPTSFYWSEDEIEYLKQHYGKDNVENIAIFLNRSAGAVRTKAEKLGLITREYWSDDELKILKEYYPIKTVDEMVELLPKRNRKTIIMKACDLKIKSSVRYSDKDKDYVIAHYKDLTDKEMADASNRSSVGIMYLRYRLGLFKQTEYSCLSLFKDVFRDSLSDWKDRSMKNCSYRCVVTGKNFDHIHHLYSFSSICSESLESLSIDLSKPFEEYKPDMERIVEEFKRIHDTYPLGVCVSEEVHIEFHKKYGNRNNTPEQWEEFVKSYNK